MSKKDVNIKEVYAEIAKKAGLPEEDAKVFLAALDKDSVAAILKEHTMTRSDYSRAMDEVQKERNSLEGEKARYQQGYEKNVIWFNQNQKLLADADGMRKRLAELEGRDPDPNPNPNPAPDLNGKFATPDDVRSSVRSVFELVEQLDEVKDRYRRSFGEHMPFDKYQELKAVAMKPENINRPLRDVYRDFIAPAVEERNQAAREADLKKARDEGYKEGLSKARFPAEGEVPPEELGPMWANRPEKPMDDSALERTFVEAATAAPTQ